MTPPRRTSPRFAAAACAAVVLAVASAAFACNVPVFRYALEHWSPDAYRGVVFHRGPLSETDRAALVKVSAASPGAPVNLAIREVDLDASPAPADVALAESLKNAAWPQLVVQYPARHQLDSILWNGSLEAAPLQRLADSPARQELLKRLIAGQTAIWVLVESGQASADDTAELVLDEELKNLTTTLKLPVQTDAPEDAIGDGPELRVEFSILRIARNDEAEAAFISMLINAESDLADLNEPLVFPVFGRCRSLLPLVGAGITPENIRGSARFLAGACSCQVKEQNPGFDLLVTADWGDLIPWAKSPVSAAFGELAGSGKPELIPIASGPVANSPSANAAEPDASAVAAATPAAPQAATPAPVADSPVAPTPVPLADAPLEAMDGVPESVPISLMMLGGAVVLIVAAAGFFMARR